MHVTNRAHLGICGTKAASTATCTHCRWHCVCEQNSNGLCTPKPRAPGRCTSSSPPSHGTLGWAGKGSWLGWPGSHKALDGGMERPWRALSAARLPGLGLPAQFLCQ